MHRDSDYLAVLVEVRGVRLQASERGDVQRARVHPAVRRRRRTANVRLRNSELRLKVGSRATQAEDC